MIAMPDAHRCTYQIAWSAQDGEYVATVTEFPCLSWLAAAPADALAGLIEVVRSTCEDERPVQVSPVASRPERTCTRQHVINACNRAAELIACDHDIYLGNRDQDLIIVLTAAISSLLDNPEMTLDAIIKANWQEQDNDSNDITLSEVRGWLS